MTLVKENWLDGATVSGALSTVEEVPGATRVVVQVSTTGNPTNAAVQLVVSIDGVNWVELNAASWPTAPIKDYGRGGSGDLTLFRFIRLKVSALSGGSSPTVSASAVVI